MTAENNPGNYHRSTEQLHDIENKMSVVINSAYARAALDRVAIDVQASLPTKPVDEAHEILLAQARQRIGHLTGSVAVREP